MTKKIIFSVIFGILVLGLFGFSENGYANHAPPYTGTDGHCDVSLNPPVALVDYSNCDLSGIDLSNAYLPAADLSSANLTGGNFVNTEMPFSNLTNADFSNAILVDATINGSYMYGIDLSDADLTNAILAAGFMSGSDLSGAILSGVLLVGADLSNSDLVGADLSDSDSQHVNFSFSDLSGTDFSLSRLASVNFTNAELSNVNLSDTDMRQGILIDANLTNVNLDNSFLRGADLSGADLSFATLKNADLRPEFFQYPVNLTNANLFGADLLGADLTGTITTGANLNCLNHPICVLDDSDGDGIFDVYDVNPLTFDDSDNDGVGDGFDICPGFDDTIDTDMDGDPNGCDNDIDGDGLTNNVDPDDDGDGIDDVIDTEPIIPSNGFSDGVTSGEIQSGKARVTLDADGKIRIEKIGNDPVRVKSTDTANLRIVGEVTLKKGSLNIEVISGTAEVEFLLAGEVIGTTTLIAGDNITFDELLLQLTNNGSETVILSSDSGDIFLNFGDTVTIEPPEIFDGCGAGYWKNPEHFDEWPEGVNPEVDPFVLVFVFSQGFFSEPPIPTYLDVLEMKGGSPMDKLGKEVLVAALNLVHPEIDYGLNEEQLSAIVTSALENNDSEEILDGKGQLEHFNNMICLLD